MSFCFSLEVLKIKGGIPVGLLPTQPYCPFYRVCFSTLPPLPFLFPMHKLPTICTLKLPHVYLNLDGCGGGCSPAHFPRCSLVATGHAEDLTARPRSGCHANGARKPTGVSERRTITGEKQEVET